MIASYCRSTVVSLSNMAYRSDTASSILRKNMCRQDRFYPPDTGGKNAISSPSQRGVSIRA